MNYFVTGATGFIGRHLVAGAAEARGDDLRARARRLARQARRARSSGWDAGEGATRRRARRPVEAGARDRGLRRRPIDHFFHLAAVYDMEADEESARARQRRGHAPRDRVRQLASRSGRFHHTSSIAVAGDVPRRVPGGHVRRGPAAAAPLPRGPSTSPSSSCASDVKAQTLVYRPGIVVGHSRDRRDGQDRRSLLLLQAAPEAARTRCPSGSRSPAPRAARPTSCRSTSSPGRWTTSPTWPTTSSAGRHLPPGRTRSRMTVGESLNEFAKAAHAPQLRDADRLEPDERRPDASARGPAGAARPSRRSATRSTATSGSRRAAMEHRDFNAKFDARDTQRALTGTGIAVPPLSHLRGQALGLLGAQPRPGPVPRPQPGQRRQGQAHPDHRRLERDRRRDGGEDRRGRRRGDPRRRARARSSRRWRRRSRRRAARRTSTRPTSPTSRTSSAWPHEISSSTAAWTCW